MGGFRHTLPRVVIYVPRPGKHPARSMKSLVIRAFMVRNDAWSGVRNVLQIAHPFDAPSRRCHRSSLDDPGRENCPFPPPNRGSRVRYLCRHRGGSRGGHHHLALRQASLLIGRPEWIVIAELSVSGSLAVIAMAVSYNTGMFALSLRGQPAPCGTTAPRLYVFLLACLNEEKVIAASLARIAELRVEHCLALVIDDASDDRTAEVVRSAAGASPRVHLYRRSLPDARRGKGAALNAGLRH